jgi:hypothetical protein
MARIFVVVPTIREDRMKAFRDAWMELFIRHAVTLVTIWDGDRPGYTVHDYGESRGDLDNGGRDAGGYCHDYIPSTHIDLFCRLTDACRNFGFVVAAHHKADYVLTLDDDVVPTAGDPIEAHLQVMGRPMPISWFSTAHATELYPRGFPYRVRDEAPVMLSHGVWVGMPDFDGETQLRLTERGRVPEELPYYVGPVPRGALFPMSGMNVMVTRDALPYFYFAPMGPDSGFPQLNRFADIFCGLFLKREFDRRNWACYTGASTVRHIRASDPHRNVEAEALGRRWLEEIGNGQGQFSEDAGRYFQLYAERQQRYFQFIHEILRGR